MLRNLGLEKTKQFCDKGIIETWLALGDYRPEIDKDLKNFVVKLEPYLENVKTRIENSIFDIYTQDKNLFDNICNDLKSWITTVWEPENQEYLDFLLSSNNVKILCDELPHKRYKYKVHIKHKINEEARKSFFNWIKNYNNKIYATGESAKWLENNFYFTWNPSVFVEDQATLSMVGLFLSGSILKVEEYVARNSINTP